jgi:hypothetical protein
MKPSTSHGNAFRRSAAIAVVATLSGVLGGCAYSGITSTPDGTVIVARNSMLGANRKLYVCKVAGQDLSCVESKSSP